MDSKPNSRRELLKFGVALAGGATVALRGKAQAQEHNHPATPGPENASPMIHGSKEQIEYGQRSKYVTSVRMAHPMGGRASPDVFGKVFHVATPLQDSVGVITPSSLHYVATTRGSYLPDIDPTQHTLTLHGLVDRPLTLTVDDLKRFPSVTRLHFLECAGNRHDGTQKTVQESHGMTSCSEWTGVLLSTLLKECGLKGSAKWFVAEGAEEVKGASSIPIAKGMDDCLIAYGQNGEPLRPQQGFPVRLMVPGFEGIYHTKFLRRIKVVDQFYMNYNEFGHLRPEAKELALGEQIGPKSVITYPSGSRSSCRAPGSTRSAGSPGPVAAQSRPWKCPPMAGRSGTAPNSRTLRNAWRTSDSATSGDGMEARPKFCRAAPTRSGRGSQCGRRSPIGGKYRSSGTTECPGSTTA